MTPNQIRHSRIEEESWTCESCQDEFDSDGMCEHDGNIHTMCVSCCEEEYREQFGPLERDDRD